MRRTLFNILCIFSLLMLVLSVGMCIYSIFKSKALARVYPTPSPTQGGITHSGRGMGVIEGWCVLICFDQTTYPAVVQPMDKWLIRDISMDEAQGLEAIDSPIVRLPGLVLWHFGGVVDHSGWVIAIHFGWLILFFSILPIYWLLTRERTPQRRARLGLCIACGYDMRGSAGRCPECGAAIVQGVKPPNQ